MAHVEESGSSGKRKANVDLNIVPFIDLMSVCIIFLLLTAVWTQVSMIQIGTSIYGKRTDPNQVDTPPRPEIPFRLDVLPSGYRVLFGQGSFDVPKADGEYDQRALIVKLKEIKSKYPEKVDAMIAVAEELNYEDMIKGMDSLLVSGFTEVSVQTGAVK